MTSYHLTPPMALPSLAVQEAKEKRRREMYTHFNKKIQVQSQVMA